MSENSVKVARSNSGMVGTGKTQLAIEYRRQCIYISNRMSQRAPIDLLGQAGPTTSFFQHSRQHSKATSLPTSGEVGLLMVRKDELEIPNGNYMILEFALCIDAISRPDGDVS